MKQLLIAKLGSTFPALVQDHGDFEDWIRVRLGVPSRRVVVVDGRHEPLPAPTSFAGIVVTGSHAMVTEHEPWSETAAQWIARAVDEEVALLGICYGHQLLAYATGGEVGPNPNGREFGTVEITLHASAQADPLLDGIPAKVPAHVSHAQSVLRLPPGARCLASSDRDPCHAFVLGTNAWGVQFHPEFDEHVVRTYIRQCADLLRAEGESPERLLDTVRETPAATSLLSRFAQLSDGACL